jgi:hypothetical protein
MGYPVGLPAAQASLQTQGFAANSPSLRTGHRLERGHGLERTTFDRPPDAALQPVRLCG